MRKEYISAWQNFRNRDKETRLILGKIQRSLKHDGQPYKLTLSEIQRFNLAREAWFEFLRTARQ